MRSQILPFDVPKPTAAKASLRSDVVDSVARSIQKLPDLGRLNPAGALIVERTIDDYMPPPPRQGTHERRHTAAHRTSAVPNRVLRDARHWADEGRQRAAEARARITTSRGHIVETQRRNNTALAYALALGSPWREPEEE